MLHPRSTARHRSRRYAARGLTQLCRGPEPNQIQVSAELSRWGGLNDRTDVGARCEYRRLGDRNESDHACVQQFLKPLIQWFSPLQQIRRSKRRDGQHHGVDRVVVGLIDDFGHQAFGDDKLHLR